MALNLTGESPEGGLMSSIEELGRWGSVVRHREHVQRQDPCVCDCREFKNGDAQSDTQSGQEQGTEAKEGRERQSIGGLYEATV